ncbi:conjugal transfer protein TraF [Colwellia ponticola]|uniref:Conjugal transfer protein TraF n=1 Tax=Colwellia ponticola TaxID=2304625 RepID=A0A8H2PLD1_9GAMM|nr:conjugal transfer protein TraF [Colwellia ponticola]TMM47758.1 hypothetical protein FCS21_01965 [Colwellia ponticola]
MSTFIGLTLTKTCLKTLKKTAILVPFMVLALPSYAESFTAKRVGQGFTGLTQDFTSSLSNPALLTKFDNDDDVFVSLNVGISAADQYDVIDTAEDISDNLDKLVTDLAQINTQNQAQSTVNNLNQQVDNIIDDLKSIDQKNVKIRNGVNLQILIPNKQLSFGLFTSQYGRIGGSVDYSASDELILEQAVDNCVSGTGTNPCELDLNSLSSVSLAVGYSVAEVGFIAAYPAIKEVNYDVSIGTKIKYQRIDLFYKRALISDFDDDDFDITSDENTTDKSAANADLGFYIGWGEDRQWHAALVTNNLMKQTVHHVEQDITFNLETSVTFGLSYQNKWLSLATEIDLTDREHFTALAPSKYAGVGAEFRFYQHMQFRLGYRTDIKDVDDDIFTAGIGISPWDVFAIDIAAFTGGNDTLGAALQLSVKI